MRYHRIDLLIPGLFGPMQVGAEDLPETPCLARLLGRADRLAGEDRDPLTGLSRRFGAAGDAEHDLPSAPFCRLADAHGPDAGAYWMHADPIHLRADRDQLLLFDVRHLDLTRVEAQALVALFNDHFADEGFELEAPVAERWYLRLKGRPRIGTTPLHAAVGRSIDGLLPRGKEGMTWVRRLNEVQMLFHHADLNRQRDAEGRPTVSGIWLWGGGALPHSVGSGGYGCVYAEHPFAQGLAAASGIECHPLPEAAGTLLSQAGDGDVLVYWDRLWPAVLDADAASWTKEAQWLDGWLVALADELGRSASLEIDLDPCNGERYRLRRWSLRRFWRRSMPIGKRLSPPPPR
jgi:hypothetical protein